MVEISAWFCKTNGSMNGMSAAITKLLSRRENATNSTFFLFKLVITGAAIAVGAIAVIKAVCANSTLKGFIKRKNNEAVIIIEDRITKCFLVIISRSTLTSRNEKKSITIRKYLIKNVYSCPWGNRIPVAIVRSNRIVFIKPKNS